jgi:hypothetical protein
MGFDWGEFHRREALRDEGERRGAEARKLRADPALGEHSSEYVRAQRERAIRTAAVCGDCFQPLAPADSVTMELRLIDPYEFRKDDKWARVPICLVCTLTGVRNDAERVQHWREATDPDYRWQRLRCAYCRRPIRLYSYDFAKRRRLLLPVRCCCSACLRLAMNERNRLRRRVEHRPKPCEICGKSFTPRRAGARTCSVACRHRAYRCRKRGPSLG